MNTNLSNLAVKGSSFRPLGLQECPFFVKTGRFEQFWPSKGEVGS